MTAIEKHAILAFDESRLRSSYWSAPAYCSGLGCSPLMTLSQPAAPDQLAPAPALFACWVAPKTCLVWSIACTESLDCFSLSIVPPPSVPAMSRSLSVVFFSCGEEGHMRSSCPKRGRICSAPRGPACSGARSVRDVTHPHFTPLSSSSSSYSSHPFNRWLGAVSGFCFSSLSSSVASNLSLAPLVVCLLHVHCLFPCHLRSVGREELFACLLVFQSFVSEWWFLLIASRFPLDTEAVLLVLPKMSFVSSAVSFRPVAEFCPYSGRLIVYFRRWGRVPVVRCKWFFFEYSSAELVFSVGSRFLMSIGATIFFGSEPPMLSSPSGSVPIIVACERRRCGPQSRC